jgi:hypothetical protein
MIKRLKQIMVEIYFRLFSIIGSWIVILSKMECNMIQIIAVIVTLNKIVISFFGHTKYGTYFPFMNKY